MRTLAYRLIPHAQPLQLCRRIHAVPCSLYTSEDSVLYRPKITRTFLPPALMPVSLVIVPESHVRQFYDFAKLAAKARHMIRGIPSITATFRDMKPSQGVGGGWAGTVVLFALDARPFENFLPLMGSCRDAGVDWAFVPSRQYLAAGKAEGVGVVMVVPWMVGVTAEEVKTVDSRQAKKELDFREAAKKIRALFSDLKAASP